MKVLSVKQPWADAIVHGPKRVENRTWLTAYRGPLAIHASLVADRTLAWLPDEHPLFGYLRDLGSRCPDERGAIIGTANLVGCHSLEDCVCDGDDPGLGAWAHMTPSTTHLLLADVVPLEQPYPWRGALGIRELPEATARHLG